jgi:hypothetical protein
MWFRKLILKLRKLFFGERNVKPECLLGPLPSTLRRLKAFAIRKATALFYKNKPIVCHPCNGDEERYRNKIASFSKALPHDKFGEVNVNAYKKYIDILDSGKPERFEELPLAGDRKFVNPQAAYAFELIGPDSHQLVIPSAPEFSSAESAAEMVELYWQALTRDVPFNEYDSHPYTVAAARELTTLSDFRGPKENGRVTPETLFRGNNPGALVGPYVSQFLWKDVPYVSSTLVQRYQTTLSEDDHLTTYRNWLAVQNGGDPPTKNKFDPIPLYIRNGRDLGEYVHNDITVETGLTAALIILSYGEEALDLGNPYLTSKTQNGFSTFGGPHVLDFVTKAARPALEAAWFQKWLVHRRLRPEEFGGRIHNKLMGRANYPIHSDVLKSEALALTFEKYKSYLLPQAYEEGCPTHPAYPAGHATFIGAMVTMLKAFFNESFIIPEPVVASSDGLSLLPYKGDLTVGRELDKLAFNISLGRDAAGVHYRSNGISLMLGEEIAIGILHDYRKTYNEDFRGFSLTKFDGTKIKV